MMKALEVMKSPPPGSIGRKKALANKENNCSRSSVDIDLDWRRQDDERQGQQQQQRSKGISPQHFHGSEKKATTTMTAEAATQLSTASLDFGEPSHYGKRQRYPRLGQASVQKLHDRVQESLIREERKRLQKVRDTQRSAFKKVTSLRTMPIQSQAMEYFELLMKEHMCEENKKASKVDSSDNDLEKISTRGCSLECVPPNSSEQQQQPPDCSDPATNYSSESSSSLLASSSSSSSGTSVDKEPKRLLRNLSRSPAQSLLKIQYQQQFLAEQTLLKQPVVDNKVTNATSAANQQQQQSLFGEALWSMEPRVFSRERNASGKRKYVVGHLGRFMDSYWRRTDMLHRHYYELIREKTPCRLYFDLEFSKAANSSITESLQEELLTEFFEELADEIKSLYGISIKRPHVVDLDSSTDSKFSRHWIVHLPDQSLFANTAAVGHFVKNFVGRLADQQATGHLLNKQGRDILHQFLFVNAAPSKGKGKCLSDSSSVTTEMNSPKTCFVDVGVYTRNRLFRLLGSTKFGKPPSAALRIADSNQFPFPSGFGNDLFYLPAMEKQQQCKYDRPDGGGNNIKTEDEDVEAAARRFIAATDWTLHAQALAETLVVPVNASKINFPILPFTDKGQTKIAADDSNREIGLPSTAQKSTPHGSRVTMVSSSSSNLSFGFSPYIMVDNFVTHKLGTRGGVQGSIRAWSIDRDAKGLPLSITYQMSRNRWCECVGRAHKSNNIMWVIDFRSFQCVQMCHDPECRALHFRGKPVDLPCAVREALEDLLFEEQLGRIDESELLISKKKEIASDAASSSNPESLDEEAFEEALMALNIDDSGKSNGEQQPKSKHRFSNDGTEVSKGHEVSQDHANLLVDTSLSDQTLLDACGDLI